MKQNNNEPKREKHDTDGHEMNKSTQLIREQKYELILMWSN